MRISIEGLSTALHMAEVDANTIERFKQIVNKTGKTHFNYNDGGIPNFVAKIGKVKTNEQIKTEITQKCKTFNKNTKDLLLIVVLVMALAASLGIVFAFGASLSDSNATTAGTTQPDIMATA